MSVNQIVLACVRADHPPGGPGRYSHRPEPIVPRGDEASRVVPAAGGRHRAREAHGVPEWARPEALALQVVKRLTAT